MLGTSGFFIGMVGWCVAKTRYFFPHLYQVAQYKPKRKQQGTIIHPIPDGKAILKKNQAHFYAKKGIKQHPKQHN